MMFDQVPKKYEHSVYGKQMRDYKHFLDLLNNIMTKSPTYNDTSCIGFPINAILDWAMCTEGDFATFLNNKLNVQFKKVLNHWGTFLKSVDSKYVLLAEKTRSKGRKTASLDPASMTRRDQSLSRHLNVTRKNRITALPAETIFSPGNSGTESVQLPERVMIQSLLTPVNPLHIKLHRVMMKYNYAQSFGSKGSHTPLCICLTVTREPNSLWAALPIRHF